MATTTAKLGDRRDARRNRERLVAVARELFATHGADAGADRPARRVGGGTLYRYFPTRADLVDAVLEEAFEELSRSHARPSAAGGPDAPGGAYRRDHRQHYNVTFTLLAVAAVAYALLQSLVAPALLEIQHDLHTTTAGAAWILTAYLLSASVCTPIAGRLGDMFGKKRTMVIVLLILAAGTALAALATSIGVMITARVIQGAGVRCFRSRSRSSATSSRDSACRTASP